MTIEPAATGPVRSGDGMASLLLATRNAAALRAGLAHARGHRVTRRPGLLSVTGDERSGSRILLLSPDPEPGEVKELARRQPAGGLVVEDPFGSVDLGELGLTPQQVPVMVRYGGPASAPSSVDIIRVERGDQLETAERIVVDGFPLPGFQPHRPAEAFPVELLRRPGFQFFLATRAGVPAGACVTVTDGAVCGAFWVTTLPEHRSNGVGRALMDAVLVHVRGLPVTLTATRAGKPLYDSMGFRTLADATWWM